METNNSENLKRLRHENDDLENCSKRTKTNILESNKSPHHRDNASHKSETPKTNRSVRRLVLSELSPNTNVNKKLDFSHQENALLSLKTPSPNAPVTPTTNFRLLTSLAASLSYAGEPSSNKIRLPNRRLVLTEETRPLKVSSQIDTTLGSSDTNISNPSFTDALECSEIIGSQSLVNLTDEESQDCNLSEKADRKKKALGLLCDRFLQLFTELPSNKKKESFHLAEIAEMLCVCKRRIYDVTIILNSLGIIRKIKCNFYKWLGKNEMIKTLKGLRAQAIELQQSLKIKEVTEMELNSYLCKIPFESENNESSELVIGEVVEISTRKDKGLSEMSKKFLMLFLESPEERICLDIAAKALYPETSIDALKLKTRVRRLYDIANVLQSLELIKKEFSNDLRGRRSAFVYSGPVFWELTPEDAKNPSFSRNENVSVIVESVKNFSSKLSIKDECQSKPCKLLQTELLPCLTNEQSVTTRKLLKCKKNAGKWK